MAKEILYQGVGNIQPGSGGNLFSVTSLQSPKTIWCEGMEEDDFVRLYFRNYDEDDWEVWRIDGKEVQVGFENRSVTPLALGTFAVGGEVSGNVTIFTEDGT